MPFSIASNGNYVLHIEVTARGVSGLVRILRDDGAMMEVARTSCEVAATSTSSCAASLGVTLRMADRYLVDFQLYDLRTGQITSGGFASLLK